MFNVYNIQTLLRVCIFFTQFVNLITIGIYHYDGALKKY